MSEWKQGAAKRRDERNSRGPVRQKPGPAKKDTKRWCRGKVGVEHKTECRVYRDVKNAYAGKGGDFLKGWRVLVCTECGKELATHYPFGAAKKDPPAWVTC